MIGWFIGQLIFWVGLITILMRRYDYGIESAEDRMEQYRYGDFRDDIAAVKR